MRALISIIVLAVIIGGVSGYIAGHRMADEYPYSLEQEKEALAKKAEASKGVPEPPAAPVVDASKPHPAVALDEEIHDFGVFEKEQKGKYAFVVRNEGNASLALSMLDKSCSCTSVDISRTSVPPGRDARITIHWEPNNAGGSYQQAVEIGTNDPTRPRFQLRVKGVYAAPIIASPNPVQLNAFFGQETSNQSRIYFFEEVTVKEITSNNSEYFSASFGRSELTKEELGSNMLKSAKAVYDVTVTLKPGMKIGHFNHKLVVHSDSTLMPEFSLSVSGQVLGNLAIVSSDYDEKTGVFNLGTAYRGTPVKKTLTLRFSQSEEITPEFKVVSKTPEWLDVTLGRIIFGAGGNNLVQVTIGVPEDANLGTSDMNDEENVAAVVIESNIPEISTIRVPVRYDIREPVAK